MLHQFPGLAELFELRVLRVWSNAQRLMIFDDGRQKNVPGVLGKNIGDKKINVVTAVWEFDPVRGVYAVVRPLRIFGPHSQRDQKADPAAAISILFRELLEYLPP